jgi:hypothetical protein
MEDTPPFVGGASGASIQPDNACVRKDRRLDGGTGPAPEGRHRVGGYATALLPEKAAPLRPLLDTPRAFAPPPYAG